MDVLELKNTLKIEGEIERVNGNELSYADFVKNYLAKNQPVVLTNLMDHWKACDDWVDDFGNPNFEFFDNHFGKSQVQVADCYNREFSDQRRVEMSVSEFIRYWISLKGKNKDFHHDVSTDACNDESLLYLKDWHFVKEYPGYEAYVTPSFFNDDWLNLYLDKYHLHNDPDYQVKDEISCSDYRFVYMGPKGTWTPLHADVFRSYSWSANVCGTKLWLFLPPAQRHLVFDRHMKNSVYNIFEDVNQSKFPGFTKAVWLECTQLKNEIIFVPSGWYHQVHNLEDAISINHNWFNAYNLDWVWDLLVGDYSVAKELIEDVRDICDDFESLCQRNLAANTGMNFYDFFTFIVRICFANLLYLGNLSEGCKSDLLYLGNLSEGCKSDLLYLGNLSESCKSDTLTSCSWTQHTILNLMAIRKVAIIMKSTSISEDSGILLDMQKSLSDPSFEELCLDINKIYGKLHGQCCHFFKDGKALQNGINHLDLKNAAGSVVSNPRSLINLIDCFVNSSTHLLDDLLVDELREDKLASP